MAEELDQDRSASPVELVAEAHALGIIGTLDLFQCEPCWRVSQESPK